MLAYSSAYSKHYSINIFISFSIHLSATQWCRMAKKHTNNFRTWHLTGYRKLPPLPVPYCLFSPTNKLQLQSHLSANHKQLNNAYYLWTAFRTTKTRELLAVGQKKNINVRSYLYARRRRRPAAREPAELQITILLCVRRSALFNTFFLLFGALLIAHSSLISSG